MEAGDQRRLHRDEKADGQPSTRSAPRLAVTSRGEMPDLLDTLRGAGTKTGSSTPALEQFKPDQQRNQRNGRARDGPKNRPMRGPAPCINRPRPVAARFAVACALLLAKQAVAYTVDAVEELVAAHHVERRGRGSGTSTTETMRPGRALIT